MYFGKACGGIGMDPLHTLSRMGWHLQDYPGLLCASIWILVTGKYERVTTFLGKHIFVYIASVYAQSRHNHEFDKHVYLIYPSDILRSNECSYMLISDSTGKHTNSKLCDKCDDLQCSQFPISDLSTFYLCCSMCFSHVRACFGYRCFLTSMLTFKILSQGDMWNLVLRLFWIYRIGGDIGESSWFLLSSRYRTDKKLNSHCALESPWAHHTLIQYFVCYRYCL